MISNVKNRIEIFIGLIIDLIFNFKIGWQVKYNAKKIEIIEMIGRGEPACIVYEKIAILYESRHPGMRCSLLELHGNKLRQGGAPSLPKEYSDAIDGLEIGPDIGSCGTSMFIGKRVLVDNIEIDSRWVNFRKVALSHGIRSCWSEPIINSSGKVLGAFGMYYNHIALPSQYELRSLNSAASLASLVMERDQNKRLIKDLTFKDKLTGFASRSCFSLSLDQSINDAKDNNERFGVVYIDLDNFKSINDILGLDIGDKYLQFIAKKIELVDNDVQLISRLGADEFGIIVKEENAILFAQRCLEFISERFEISGRKISQSASIGIAFYPEHGSNSNNLLKASNMALYHAKSRGRNQYVIYDKSLTELADLAEYEFNLEQFLEEAIDNRSLYLVYQPQIDLNSNDIVGVESLARWYHPKLGNVSPEDFVKIAERSGLIKKLTEYILMTACTEAVLWEKSGCQSIRLAINISPALFLEQDFLHTIKRVLEKTKMNPHNLELEVTETIIQTNLNNTTVFQDLRNLGISLAIDDFGIGFSSLASLKHLDIDVLKIDKYFINDLIVDRKSFKLVESIIAMAHKLGYIVVAEGVENIRQVELLKNMKCDIIQGYFFHKPYISKEIRNKLNIV